MKPETQDKRCEVCGNMRGGYDSSMLCVGDLVAKPVETVAHFRGRCGIERKLWVPVKPAKGEK